MVLFALDSSGLGQQAMYLMSGVYRDARRVDRCSSDVYGIKRERFVKRVTAHYASTEQNVGVEVYEDYKQLIARDDIDAVIIATPDHWHAHIAIDACKAKKNIYLEKAVNLHHPGRTTAGESGT